MTWWGTRTEKQGIWVLLRSVYRPTKQAQSKGVRKRGLAPGVRAWQSQGSIPSEKQKPANRTPLQFPEYRQALLMEQFERAKATMSKPSKSWEWYGPTSRSSARVLKQWQLPSSRSRGTMESSTNSSNPASRNRERTSANVSRLCIQAAMHWMIWERWSMTQIWIEIRCRTISC